MICFEWIEIFYLRRTNYNKLQYFDGVMGDENIPFRLIPRLQKSSNQDWNYVYTYLRLNISYQDAQCLYSGHSSLVSLTRSHTVSYISENDPGCCLTFLFYSLGYSQSEPDYVEVNREVSSIFELVKMCHSLGTVHSSESTI